MPEPDTSHYLRNALKNRRNWSGADEGVFSALKIVYESATNSHSSTSKPHSLATMVKRRVDIPFANWLSKSGFLPFPFSDYLKKVDATVVEDLLKTYSRIFVANNRTLRADLASTEHDALEAKFFATSDILIDFSRFCYALGPAEKPVAVMYSEDKETGEKQAPFLKRGRRDRLVPGASSGVEELEPYLRDAIHFSYTLNPSQKCLACDSQTEEEDLRNEFLGHKLEEEIRSHLQKGGEFTAGGHQYSRSYCQIHSEVTNKAGNRRALRHRIGFASIIAAMRHYKISKSVDCKIIPMEFWPRFSALAMDSRKCKKHTKRIETLTPFLYEKNRVIASPTELRKAFKEVIVELQCIYELLGLSSEMFYPEFWDTVPDLSWRVAKSSNPRTD